MIRTLSQTESARRDTIVTRADGVALDRLSLRLWGLSRPHTYPRDAWAQMLKALMYQPRGTMRSVFAVLDALFYPWTELTKISVTVSSSGGVSHSSLTQSHGSRWVWFTSDAGVRTLTYTTSATAGSLQLAVTPSSLYDVVTGEATGTLEFLPFVLTERDCVVSLLLDAELLGAPPSYLQSPDGSARPSGQPLGGVLLNLFDLDPDTLDYGDQTQGPFPLYLTGGEVNGVLGGVMRCLLPAGVHFEARAVTFGDALGYGPLYALPRFGRVGPPNLGI